MYLETVTPQSVTHIQSFKEIYFMSQNGYEDLTDTEFLFLVAFALCRFFVLKKITHKKVLREN